MKWSLLASCILSSFYLSAQPMGRLKVVVHPMFNTQDLHLGETRYVDNHGDSLYVDVFRFYLSHCSIGENRDSACHLIDAADPLTNIFSMDVLPGQYNTISCVIGVDSSANVSGALSGDLDPVKGMYWAWNTGYIMAKMEGRSPSCKTLHHEFQFHIGGYRSPYIAARKVMIPMSVPITVVEGKTVTVDIQANAATWFNWTPVQLAEMNDVVMPGMQSMTIADNYSHMLTITSPRRQ